MKKEASIQDLIDMCNQIGWDTGIAELEKIVLQNENIQAGLFAGSSSDIKKAQKMSTIIIKQNNSISRLKQYRAKYKL